MKKAFLLIAAALVSGCVDRGACLAGHNVHYEESSYTQMIDFGQGMIVPIVQTTPAHDEFVCDTWEFPNGKPKEKDAE